MIHARNYYNIRYYNITTSYSNIYSDPHTEDSSKAAASFFLQKGATSNNFFELDMSANVPYSITVEVHTATVFYFYFV